MASRLDWTRCTAVLWLFMTNVVSPTYAVVYDIRPDISLVLSCWHLSKTSMLVGSDHHSCDIIVAIGQAMSGNLRGH